MSSLIIKLIAAFSMLIDHMGLILFPDIEILRIIGRLSYPLYAFCIAEGFRHTRNRIKYFLRIFLLGFFCQTVYFIVDRSFYQGILIVFSFSIIIMYFTDSVKKEMRHERSSLTLTFDKLSGSTLSSIERIIISWIMLFISVTTAFIFCDFLEVDYGFFGIMLPVFTSIFNDRNRRILMFSAGLLALCIDIAYTQSYPIQFFALFSLPLVALYNEKTGKYKLKYFFYFFYPTHLALIYVISMLK